MYPVSQKLLQNIDYLKSVVDASSTTLTSSLKSDYERRRVILTLKASFSNRNFAFVASFSPQSIRRPPSCQSEQCHKIIP